jgi:hypothetical protein
MSPRCMKKSLEALYDILDRSLLQTDNQHYFNTRGQADMLDGGFHAVNITHEY